MAELYRDSHMIVTRDDTAKIVRVRRTTIPVAFAVDIYAMHANLTRIVPVRERLGLSVLIDVRDAPMISSDTLEVEAVKVIDSMASDFERAALLVRTAVGALQVRRIAKTNPFRLELFEDESAALAYLSGMGPMPGSTGRRSSLPPPPTRNNR